jgi:hypothetical protein
LNALEKREDNKLACPRKKIKKPVDPKNTPSIILRNNNISFKAQARNIRKVAKNILPCVVLILLIIKYNICINIMGST